MPDVPPGGQILIIHGSRDRIASPARSAALARRLSGHARVSYISVEGGKHAMLRRHRVFDRLAAAGGDGLPVATAEETAAHWREVIESDLTATFLTVSAFLPARRRGGGRAVPRARAVLLDHRGHARPRRRQDHALITVGRLAGQAGQPETSYRIWTARRAQSNSVGGLRPGVKPSVPQYSSSWRKRFSPCR
jgi:NAD(P)-dependent dehydrogenase (short-subunit alcohol dehydrogenase family)